MSLRNRIVAIVLFALLVVPIAGQAASPDVNPDGQPLVRLNSATIDFDGRQPGESAPESAVYAHKTPETTSESIVSVLSRFLTWLQAVVQPL